MASILYLGSSPDIQQVSTVTVGGSWLTAETSTLTIGGVALTFTVGSDTATSGIAEIIQRMIEGLALKNDESRTNVGTDFGQWINITATYSGSVVTLKADRDVFGDSEPFTITKDTTGSSAGTLTIAQTTASKGRYHADDVTNWDSGTLPGAVDVAIVEGAGKNIKYGLTSIADASLIHFATFDGDIGLPIINRRNPNKQYREYRQRHLEVEGTQCDLHVGDGDGSSLIRISRGAVVGMGVNVFGSGPGNDGPPIQLMSLNAATIRIDDGSVAMDYYDDEDTSGGVTVRMTGGEFMSRDSSSTITLLHITKGKAFSRNPITTLTMFGGEVTADGTITTLNGNGGKLIYLGTTITNATLAGTQIDLSENTNAAVTGPTVIEVEEGGEPIRDPQNLLGNYSIDCNNVDINDLKLNVGTNKRITLAAVA